MTDAHERPSVTLADGVLSDDVDGEKVLIDIRGQRYFSLDPIGADMLGRLLQTSLACVIADLARDYGVDRHVIEADARHLVEQMIAAGLLDRVGGEG